VKYEVFIATRLRMAPVLYPEYVVDIYLQTEREPEDWDCWNTQELKFKHSEVTLGYIYVNIYWQIVTRLSSTM
jgi:hypothetical protein